MKKIAIIAVLGISFFGIGIITADKSEVVDCKTQQRYAIEYSAFHSSEKEIARCSLLGIKITE